MKRTLVCVLAVAAVAACGKSDGGGGGGGPGPGPVVAKTPSAECGAAATNLAKMSAEFPTDEDVATIKTECETLLLTDAEAQCLAGAKDKLDSLKCPRVLTAELREVEEVIGSGPCRPVMLVAHLQELMELRKLPEYQRDAAIAQFEVIKNTLGEACRKDNWGKEAMDCFATEDVMRAFGCFEKVPKVAVEKLNNRLQKAMDELMGKSGGDLAEAFGATGIEACDAYLRARASFEACDAIPPTTRTALLAFARPLESAWRGLPADVLASSGTSFVPLCEQGLAQLGEIAASVGCDPSARATTGVDACDSYLRARRSFEQCSTIPDATRKSMLSMVEPLERPWRDLPASSMATAGSAYASLCDQATGQLGQLASSVGCN